MSITYTNEIKTIGDALYDIMYDELKPIPVILSNRFEAKELGQQGEYIRYWIGPSNTISYYSNGECREYEVNIYYYINQNRYRKGAFFDEVLSVKSEQLKRLLLDNRSYEPGDVYKWHYLVVNQPEYPLNVNEIDELEGYENIKVIHHQLNIHRDNDLSVSRRSMLYNVIGDYSTAANSTVLNTWNGDITINFWCKMSGGNGSLDIMYKYSDGSNYMRLYITAEGIVFFYLRQAGVNLVLMQCVTGINFFDGLWRCVGFRIDKDNQYNCDFFVNGNQPNVTQMTLNSGTFTNAATAQIGKISNNNDKLYLSEMSIWNNNIATDENFEAMYNNGVPIDVKTGIGLLPAPTYYWKFDEGSGASIIDEIGSNVLTVNGSIWSQEYP